MHLNFLRCLCCAAIAAGLLSACASAPRTAQQPINLERVQQLIEAKDFSAAAALLEQLASKERARRDAYLLDAAQNHFRANTWQELSRVLKRIERDQLKGTRQTEFDLLLAELHLHQGNALSALQVFESPEAPASAEQTRSIKSIRQRAATDTDALLSVAQQRVSRQDQMPPAQRTDNARALMELLLAADANSLRKALAKTASDGVLHPWLQRALRAKGDIPLQESGNTRSAIGAWTATDSSGRALSREGAQMAQSVALLLPLSGPLANAGKAIRDGFLAAYFAEQFTQPALHIFDSGNSNEELQKAFTAAQNAGVSQIVGPLSKEQVTTLFQSTQGSMPILALNHTDASVVAPVGAMQFGLLPDEEAAQAANRANNAGAITASIIASTEEWAERAALAFRAQFEQLGGSISGESRVVISGVDYSNAIAQAKGSRIPDVIFVAVRTAEARMLVPQLRAKGLELTPILATSAIYSGNPSRALDRDLRDVEFCDAPWLLDQTVGLPSRDRLGRTLDFALSSPRLFAMGMDAFRLLPYLTSMRQQQGAYLPGATGQLTLDGQSRIRRELTWFRFDNGMPQLSNGLVLAPQIEVNPAPPNQ